MTYLKTIAGGFVLGFALVHAISVLTDDTIYIDKEMYEDEEIINLIYLELPEIKQVLTRKKVKSDVYQQTGLFIAERKPA